MTTQRERYIARIARYETLIAECETSLSSIVTGENGEYWYSEPDGSQRATKLSPKELQSMISYYEIQIDRLHRRLRGVGLTAIRTAR